MICVDFMLVNCRGVQQCSMQQESAELAEQKEKKTKSGSFQDLLWLIRIRGIVRVFNQPVVV